MRLITPVLCLLGGLLLPAAVLDHDRAFRGRGMGPTAWPEFMLTVIAAVSVVWIVQEVAAWRRSVRSPAAAASPETAVAETYDYRKATIGMMLIVGYGWVLPLIGFTLSTVIFIIAVCMLGGFRKPLVVATVSLVGTAALLWVFVGLALMPLDRGEGVFGRFSLAVLRGLGIY